MRFEECPNCGSHTVKPLEEIGHQEPYAYECDTSICGFEWEVQHDIHFTFWAWCKEKETLDRIAELARRRNLGGSENVEVGESVGGVGEVIEIKPTDFQIRAQV